MIQAHSYFSLMKGSIYPLSTSDTDICVLGTTREVYGLNCNSINILDKLETQKRFPQNPLLLHLESVYISHAPVLPPIMA